MGKCTGGRGIVVSASWSLVEVCARQGSSLWVQASEVKEGERREQEGHAFVDRQTNASRLARVPAGPARALFTVYVSCNVPAAPPEPPLPPRLLVSSSSLNMAQSRQPRPLGQRARVAMDCAGCTGTPVPTAAQKRVLVRPAPLTLLLLLPA